MKLGIIGLPQTGKKTLFSLLTGSEISENMIGQKKPVPGFAEIRDNRFDKLVSLYEPKKEGPAKIDIQLMPDFELNTKDNDEIYRELGIVDAICLIIRDFQNDSVYHVSGSVDPLRDIDAIYGEFILHDLIFIEKRLERIEKSVKKKDDRDTKIETELLILFKNHLENNLPLRTIEINSDQLKIIQSYPFLTRKELLIIINSDEDNMSDDSIIKKIDTEYSEHRLYAIKTSLQIEIEIASLDEDEKKEFMEEIGLKESSLEIITQLSMKALGLASFFTVGKDEVKQWLVRKNSTAPEAASVIHSDIQRGFIRAEVMKYNELIEVGNEDALKKAGKLLIMGKDYIVVDGDIISFRFNV